MQNLNATSNDRSIGESTMVAELRELWLQRGEPSYRELAQRTQRSPSTINAALTAKRVPGWNVIRDLVEALGGDVDRFHKLYQLGRSERLELDGHADELSAELNMPVSRTQTDASTRVVSHGGSVFIQSGTPAPFNPLTAFAPAEIVSAYEATCLSYASGAHMAVLAMARSLVEAVCIRQDAGDPPVQGLITLAEKGVITKSLAEQGQALWQRASEAVHGQMVPLASDATDALGYVLALLSYVYIINRNET